MSLDKGVKHGKEHRKPWRGHKRSRAVDSSCRSHGGCPWCLGNRKHSDPKRGAALRSAFDGAAAEMQKQPKWVHDLRERDNAET